MVDTIDNVSQENGHSSDHEENIPVINVEEDKKIGVPLDNYCLVGWDLDVTGRRLLDEVCHIAGYTPDDSFSLYVMPHGDLSVKAKRRYMIRIITVGLYRIIKDDRSNKVVKTRSEISALTEFLDWLENNNKKQGKNGVLLICHENYKFNPYMLIKSLQEYNLLERFRGIVKGFVDCHNFAKKKCEHTMVSFTIRTLSKVLLDKGNVEIHKASDRARLAYEIVQHLCAGESDIGKGAISPDEEIIKNILPFTMSVKDEENVLAAMRVTISRQNTLKPIFGSFIRFLAPSYERKNALQLRRYLVDALIDYDTLKTAWDDKGKEGIEVLFKEKLEQVPEKQREALFKMVIDHFEKPAAPANETPSSSSNNNSGRYVYNGRRPYRERRPINRSVVAVN